MKSVQEFEDLSIRRVELNKVGVFKDLVLEFPRKRDEDAKKAEVHIFVGANGTGKTTLLEAMTFFRIKPMADFAKELGTFQSLETERGSLISKIDFDQNPHPIQIEFGNGWTCKQEQLPVNQPLPSFPFADYLKNYYFFPKPPRPDSIGYAFFAANGYRRFSEPKVKLSIENPFYLSLAFESKQTETEILQWIPKRVAQANQAQLDGDINEAKKYRRHIAAIEDAVSKIIQRKIEFRVDFIKGVVECLLDGKSVVLEIMASGHQAILNFLLDLMYRLEYLPEGNLSHFSLFLDEIDIHLHPSAQRQILPVVRELFPNAQIFLTTHSPFVIGSVDGARIYKFKLNQDGYAELDGEPIWSEDGDSYEYILQSVFDIHTRFGPEVESGLDKFYELRKGLLAKASDNEWQNFYSEGMKLASQSDELKQIITLELKQAARLLNKDLSTVK